MLQLSEKVVRFQLKNSFYCFDGAQNTGFHKKVMLRPTEFYRKGFGQPTGEIINQTIEPRIVQQNNKSTNWTTQYNRITNQPIGPHTVQQKHKSYFYLSLLIIVFIEYIISSLFSRSCHPNILLPTNLQNTTYCNQLAISKCYMYLLHASTVYYLIMYVIR